MAEEFTKVVQESSQNVANNMFAGVLGAMAQQMNMGVVPMAPMQMPEPTVPDNELATDTSNAMDSATKDMLGSLFDMDDE
jgi:hypothetical protein